MHPYNFPIQLGVSQPQLNRATPWVPLATQPVSTIHLACCLAGLPSTHVDGHDSQVVHWTAATRYKESKVGMRWRTKAEVVSGKGQFICGAKGCDQTAGLASYEVNFSYVEAGEAKQALVKLRLCEGCAAKLNHKREKQYKKLSQTSAEEQQRNGPSDRHREQQEQQQRRKQKRRDGHRGRSTSESDEGEYAAGHHGGSGSKRRRHSSPRAAQQRLQQQQARGVNHAAAGCGGKAEQGGSARLDDADIDQWLDTMFASA